MYAFVRASNPRPVFHLDMTDGGRQIVQKHVVYWTKKGEQGLAVGFGAVLDPKSVYGVGIYRVDDPAHMRRLLERRPRPRDPRVRDLRNAPRGGGQPFVTGPDGCHAEGESGDRETPVGD